MIYNVTGGNATEMTALKKYDIVDFFDYIDNKGKNGRS